MKSKGLSFRELVKEARDIRQPLQIVGAVTAYSAILAQKTG